MNDRSSPADSFARALMTRRVLQGSGMPYFTVIHLMIFQNPIYATLGNAFRPLKYFEDFRSLTCFLK
jgi:hypothetical protein